MPNPLSGILHETANALRAFQQATRDAANAQRAEALAANRAWRQSGRVGPAPQVPPAPTGSAVPGGFAGGPYGIAGVLGRATGIGGPYAVGAAFAAAGATTLAAGAAPAIGAALRGGSERGKDIFTRDFVSMLGSLPIFGHVSGWKQVADANKRAESRATGLLEDFARFNLPLSDEDLSRQVSIVAEQERRVEVQREKIGAAVGRTNTGNDLAAALIALNATNTDLSGAITGLLAFLKAKGF